MQSDICLKNTSRRVTQICGGIVFSFGVTTLLGWISGMRLLASIRSNYVPMAPNTASVFIILGGTLFIFAQWPLHRIVLRVCKMAAILDLLVSLLILVQYFFAVDLGANPLLFKTSETLNNFPLAVMSPITGGNFFLAGISFLILSFFLTDERRIKHVASCLASVIVIVGLVVILGYLHLTPLLYGGTTVPMAITTALAFIALGIGLIAKAGSHYWPQCLFTGQTTRSRLIRAFLPVTLAFFILNSWLNTNIVLGSKTNPALVLTFLLILFVIIICDIISRISGKIGGAIDRACAEREKIEKQLRVEIAGHKRSKQEADLLQTITMAISEAENLHAALSIVLRKVCETTGWVLGEAWLLCSDCKYLECAVSWYEPSVKLEEFAKKSKEFKFPPGIGLPGSVWSLKKPEWRREVITDGNFCRTALAGEFNLKSAMGIPVIANDEVVAVLGFFVRELRDEDDNLLKLLFSIAMQLGTVIQHKQAEDALRESEERLRSILDNTTALVYMKDTQGRYTFVNRHVEKLFHRKRDEIKGKTSYDFFPEGIANAHQENDRKVIESKTPMEFEEMAALEDGLHTYISVKFPLFDTTGTIYAVCGISTDITERKRMEEEKKKLREQLYHTQKIESIGTLTGGIAHDFNNILTAIVGYGNLLRGELKEDDPLRDFAQRILKSAEKAAILIRGLLAFSRKQPSNPLPVNLNELVKEAEGFLVRVIREDIKLRTVLTNKKCIVMADNNQIEQVLTNFTTNARDAMPNGGSLTISTDIMEIDDAFIKAHGYGVKGTYALMSVSDTGAGMDEITKQKIFEPFFTTKEVGKGTGLGLAIVYGIVKQHNGYVNVYSEPGKGTTFRMYLPLTKSFAEKAEIEVHTVSPTGTETLLIAEDDEAVRKFMKITLESHGYNVIEAFDGKDAMAKFMENKDKIHLLLLDVIMPNINGKEVHNAIKETSPGIKTIFMSGYCKNMIDTIFEEGVVLISKPISPTELLENVRVVLDKQG